MAAIIVIASYRPREGQSAAFETLVQEHVPLLRKGGYVSDRPAEILRELKGNCLIEIFAWASQEAAVEAASDPAVREHWARMQAAADFVPLSSLAEGTKPFCHFSALA